MDENWERVVEAIKQALAEANSSESPSPALPAEGRGPEEVR
jgi:hypothetical protein